MRLFAKSIKYSVALLITSSRYLLPAYLFLHILCATLPLFSTWVLKQILDLLTGGQAKPDIHSLVLCMSGYVISFLLLQLANSLSAVCRDSVFNKVGEQYDCNLAKKVSGLPMAYIDSSKGKDTIAHVRSYKLLVVNIPDLIIRAITSCYTFCVVFGVLASFHLWLTFLFLALTIPGILLQSVFDKKADELRTKQFSKMRKFNYYRWILTDAWPGKDVRMYNLTEPMKDRHDTEKNLYREEKKQFEKKETAAFLLSELIRRSGEIVFIIYVILKAMAGEISIGSVALYVGYAISASTAFQTMVWNLVYAYTRSNRDMGRFFEFMAMKGDDDTNGTRELTEFQSLEFDDVWFKYPYTDKYVLSGASFRMNRGDKLSIVGINGAGKSTIIKLMLGLYEAESGKILVNGYPMEEYRLRDIRKLFSVLFQSFVQYPLTVRENIALSDLDRLEDDEGIVKAMELGDIYPDMEPKMKSGLDSVMTRSFDDEGIELSKGQWQKVALSRAYFKNSPIVVFDEPSAALDAEAEDKIFRNFEKIACDRTGIMISHRISASRTATHDALIERGGLYARFYNLQKEKYRIE